MTGLPDYYFRVKENGAAVFRVDGENRLRRLEMQQIAVLNLKNGEVRAQGGHELTEADTDAINAWMDRRRATIAARQIDDIRRTVDHLNLTAQWAQSKASDDEIRGVADELLLAMHDLRSVLVRRKSQLLSGEDAPGS